MKSQDKTHPNTGSAAPSPKPRPQPSGDTLKKHGDKLQNAVRRPGRASP